VPQPTTLQRATICHHGLAQYAPLRVTPFPELLTLIQVYTHGRGYQRVSDVSSSVAAETVKQISAPHEETWKMFNLMFDVVIMQLNNGNLSYVQDYSESIQSKHPHNFNMNAEKQK
jgi:hypothetical protein